jgi:GDP-L-fucose synthase
MQTDSKIIVTGCQGMTGWAIIRELSKQGYKNVVGITHADCDLTNQLSVQELIKKEQPEYVFHAAAKVGGAKIDGDDRGQFIYDNLMMQCNIIESCRIYGVKKLLFCGTIYMYPKNALCPITENSLLKGELAETNIGYSIAKIAGVYLTKIYNTQFGCDFISVIPPNIYGIGDDFNIQTGRVIAALIHKFNEAKINNIPIIHMMGSGNSIREFICVDDLAKGLIFLMNNYSNPEHINIGTGIGVKIVDLVEIIKNITNYKGCIVWENPLEVTTERRLDVSKITSLGWQSETELVDGISKVYNWFINNYNFLRK